jgi:hypothetical protein
MFAQSPILGKYTKKIVVDIEIGQTLMLLFFVTIELIVHPLCIIPDDGDNMNKYFVVLPK